MEDVKKDTQKEDEKEKVQPVKEEAGASTEDTEEENSGCCGSCS